MIGSCKRDPAAHRPAKTRDRFNRFLESHDGAAPAEWPEHIRRLLISPARPEASPAAAEDGFYRLGLKDMALKLDPALEIRPWPEAESPTGPGRTRGTEFSR